MSEGLRAGFRRSPYGPVLFLTLVAFGRAVYGLGAKELWLDEALSLLRAAGSWPALLSGALPIPMSVARPTMLSVHPPAYFIALRLVAGLAGDSAFSLRLPSACAVTLLVPAVWTLARHLAREGVLPAATPGWAALLAAASPFYLWYGQEARMYALVALLAVLSTYLLLRWTDAGPGARGGWLCGYGLALLALLLAHFFSLLILPVHAALVYRRWAGEDRRRAWLGAGGILALGLAPLALALLELLPGDAREVAHFSSVSLPELSIDLSSALSLGLSVGGSPARWLWLLFLGLLAGGLVWTLRQPAASPRSWLLAGWLLVPVALLAAANAVRPAYTNARELSLVSGAFLLLVAAGGAWIWGRARWAGAVVAAALLAGMAYSSLRYYVEPAYAKGDLSGMGAYLQQQARPGDLLITEPGTSWPLYRYYLPVDLFEGGAQESQGTTWYNAPGPEAGWPTMDQDLAAMAGRYRRIWLATTVPDSAPTGWLARHTSRIYDRLFESPLSLLRLQLFVTPWPAQAAAPAPGALQHPVDVVFGGRLRLIGYDVGRPLAAGSAIPVDLYWQAAAPMDRRYKYRLNLIDDATGAQLAVSDREYNAGQQPTTGWLPGTTVVEYASILPPAGASVAGCHLSLWVYDAETLEPLSAVAAGVPSPAAGGSPGTSVALALGR